MTEPENELRVLTERAARVTVPLEDIVSRAHKRTRRRRVVQAIGAVLVLSLGAFGIVEIIEHFGTKSSSVLVQPNRAERDRGANYLGLSVQLQLTAPVVENGRTEVTAYFLIRNPTALAISYRGCPFGNLTYGLLPAATPDAPLTGTAETSCAGGVSTVEAGASDRYFAVMFTTRSAKARLPAGDYIAVVRFSDGTEVRKSMTLPPDP